MHGIILSSFKVLAASTQDLPEGRVFALDTQTLIGIGLQVINIIILFAILYKVLYQPVKYILSRRQENIQDQFQSAEDKEVQAQKLIDEYEEKLSSIDEERDAILSEARAQASEEKEKILQDAEKQARKLKDDVEKTLENERKQLRRNSKEQVIELSAILAEKTLRESINQKTQEEKFDESISELEQATWKN